MNVFQRNLVYDCNLCDMSQNGQGFLLAFDLMVELRQFLCIYHGNDSENFVVLKFVKVGQNDMPQNIVVEAEFQRQFSILKSIDGIQLVNYLSNKLSR